jgi:hypothetical protein
LLADHSVFVTIDDILGKVPRRWLVGGVASRSTLEAVLYLLRTMQIPKIWVLVFKVDRQKKCRYAEGVSGKERDAGGNSKTCLGWVRYRAGEAGRWQGRVGCVEAQPGNMNMSCTSELLIHLSQSSQY